MWYDFFNWEYKTYTNNKFLFVKISSSFGFCCQNVKSYLVLTKHWIHTKYRALRILKSADIILSEDTRHSRKLLLYYGITSPLVSLLHYLYLFSMPRIWNCILTSFYLNINLVLQLSYHKFNESERERSILQKLRQGEVVALISDAGTPCISDPGMELVS